MAKSHKSPKGFSKRVYKPVGTPDVVHGFSREVRCSETKQLLGWLVCDNGIPYRGKPLEVPVLTNPIAAEHPGSHLDFSDYEGVFLGWAFAAHGNSRGQGNEYAYLTASPEVAIKLRNYKYFFRIPDQKVAGFED